uniref:Uncharacterized protein n=1 Tax=Amphimedon queenslandica TaxID=400682 RepID=A0A1X7T8N3_AMPQE
MVTGENKHLALPRTLSDGSDLNQWLQKFNICATDNSCDGDTCAKKIQTFLDGEALMVHIEMADADK